MTRRGGFTLIELMAAIALGAIIVGTAYAALHAASQVISITKRQALSNALLRAAVLRSYALADRTDPALAPGGGEVELGLPLAPEEWGLVPSTWPLLRLEVASGDDRRAPMVYWHHVAWSDHQLSVVGAPYGWRDIDSAHAPGDRDHTRDVVQRGHTGHDFTLELSDPVSGEQLDLVWAVPGASGGP